MAGKSRKEKMMDADEKIIKQIEALGPQDKYTPKATQDKYDYLIGQLRKDTATNMKFGGEAKPLVGGQKKLDKNKDGRISGDDFAMMEMGGKVEKYGGGGKVKGGKMSCRGMGKALRGGGFKIS